MTDLNNSDQILLWNVLHEIPEAELRLAPSVTKERCLRVLRQELQEPDLSVSYEEALTRVIAVLEGKLYTDRIWETV